MGWVDALDDVRSLSAVFGESTSALSDEVELHEVVVHRDGPSVRLRFDLTAFPAQPPAHWATAGFNTVQVVVALTDVSACAISGVARTMTATLAIERTDDGLLSTHLRGASVDIRVTARWASLMSLQPYVNGE